MSIATFPYKSWLSDYGREDEHHAARENAKRSRAQEIVDQIAEDHPEVIEYAATIPAYTALYAALTEAVIAGMEEGLPDHA